MDLGLRGKVAIVTAASKGLGKGCALELAKEGAHVAICSRDKDRIEATAAEIEAAAPGVKVLPLAVDVTDASKLEFMVNEVITTLGRLDILVTNAGGPPPGRFDQITDEMWQRAFNLTLMSAVHLIRHCLPHMRRQHSGRIVLITSGSVKQPIQNLMLSNSIRAAVTGMAKTLSEEIGKDNITVNCVAPGRISTERITELDTDRAQREGKTVDAVAQELATQIPLGRYGSVDEFAAVVAFLCSERAGYVDGTTIPIDGGAHKGLF